MGLVIISIADVGGGDEELEGVVLVHVQLSGLKQLKILSLIGLFYHTNTVDKSVTSNVVDPDSVGQ